MLTTGFLAEEFAAALMYGEYLDTAKPNERANWEAFATRVILTDAQRALIASFARRINVLVVSGTWCGDCVQQCPIFAAIGAIKAAGPSDTPGKPGVDLRFLDRDLNLDLAERIRICGGLRVPVAIFMNEDFEFVSLTGDRTLNRYRALAGRFLGPACPLPGAPVPPDEVAATVQDWIDEFERVHLLLRLSPKLRKRYGD